MVSRTPSFAGPGHRTRQLFRRTGPVPLTEGPLYAADAPLAWEETVDLVLIPRLGNSSVVPDAKYLRAITEAHRRGAVIASLCCGAFVLAETGLLNGETATTHWELTSALTATSPQGPR